MQHLLRKPWIALSSDAARVVASAPQMASHRVCAAMAAAKH
jgi:hypothetical protein